ncbi:hypothetical protein AVEN_246289-1 [Araneus ventricosus]|uniref:Mos1 transposase HTH domain-containing protein n=1 Tax=Araneus ventricosus TaxID=182803 RepID=A0A4Y2SP86_ARAVE|nr:hypothetical protein AVEN_266860-1 [Araneus ventricosus]GBN90126.1 hypothetical protein AVEN_170011-1 [Araneus ventricosus]GBN90129.1 hypothetical protein AVEN_1130-1 [Araneus ventricosus]GBN90132.1 hypothetical protein AVEN_246289-1 [Araneus ventricosus]
MKEMYGEQRFTRCTIFRWCQRYEAGRVNIKVLPRSGQAHVVTNSATISAVDDLIRQNRRITTRVIAVELSIIKGTVYHKIHRKLGYGNVCAQWVPKNLSENQKMARQNRRITTRVIAVELSIIKGTVYHKIHRKLGYGKVCAQWVPKNLSENQKMARMGICLTQQFLH